MDLQDQLKNLFPEHIQEVSSDKTEDHNNIWLQDEPIICKYEKRKESPSLF